METRRQPQQLYIYILIRDMFRLIQSSHHQVKNLVKKSNPVK
jgi:hypothetical protein